jgi:hypothetical protein
MSPWEMKAHIEFLAGHALPDPLLEPVMKRLDKLLDAWGAAWAQYGAGDGGFTTYRRLITTARQDLDAIGGGQITLQNERPLFFVLSQLVFANAVPWRTNDPAVADNGVGSRRLAS